MKEFSIYNILSQVSANARETAIFLNNDISADEDTKCLYLRLDALVGFNFKVFFSFSFLAVSFKVKTNQARLLYDSIKDIILILFLSALP